MTLAGCVEVVICNLSGSSGCVPRAVDARVRAHAIAAFKLGAALVEQLVPGGWCCLGVRHRRLGSTRLDQWTQLPPSWTQQGTFQKFFCREAAAPLDDVA